MRMRLFGAVAAALLCAAGCGSGTSAPTVRPVAPAPTTPAPAASTVAAVPPATIRVFASTLFTAAFREIGETFQTEHPGTTIEFSFGDSAALAEKIMSGEPADVYASVSPVTMKTLADVGAASAPTVFARDQLIIVVAVPNPKRIFGLEDLARPGLRVALCAPQVPCGVAAEKVLAEAGVTLKPVSRGEDGTVLTARVKAGKADAALVHRSDGRAAQYDLQPIEFYESPRAVDDYLISALTRAPNPVGAKAFIDHLYAESAGDALYGYGLQQVTS